VSKLREDFIEMEAVDEDQSLFDSLGEIAQGLDGVEYAGVTIEHPLTKKIIFRIKTDPEKIKAKDALDKALKQLKELSAELKKALEEI